MRDTPAAPAETPAQEALALDENGALAARLREYADLLDH